METLGLIIILLLAIIYVLRHVRRTLTVGEDETKCQDCPIISMPVQDKSFSGKDN
jgi:hypothetical protein